MTQKPHAPTPIWPVQVLSLLLAGQSLGFLALIGYQIWQIDWEYEFNQPELSQRVLDLLSLNTLLLLLALMLGFTAIGFALVRHSAWLIAMLCQGSTLMLCLLVYFDKSMPFHNTNWLYLIMLSCVGMVLYLNNNDVRLAFSERHASNPRAR
jgi:hypothetical protein